MIYFLDRWCNGQKAEEEELDLDNPTVVNFLVKMQEIQCKKDQREAGAGRCGALPGSLSIEDRGANERGGRWPGNTGSGEVCSRFYEIHRYRLRLVIVDVFPWVRFPGLLDVFPEVKAVTRAVDAKVVFYVYA